MKLLGLMLLTAFSVWATVSATVQKKQIALGEQVVFTLSAEGRDAEFPPIAEIGGYRIEQKSQSQNTQIVNGSITQTMRRRYLFTPTGDVTIPSFAIKVDGKTEKTAPIQITVGVPTQAQNDAFSLKIEMDKSSAYVGEQVNLSLLFRRDSAIDIMDLEYSPSPFEHFWVKQVGKEQTYQEKSKTIHRLDYVIFPQQPGELTIDRAMMKVGVAKEQRDIFGFFVKQPSYRNVFSNRLILESKPLPAGIHLVGQFDITARVDTDRAEPNAPVNLVVEISGQGNMDDIEEIELDIPSASVYADKMTQTYELKNGVYGGVAQRKFAIVAGSDYVIEPFSITYFDPKTQKTVTKTTDPIPVGIIGAKPAKPTTPASNAQETSGENVKTMTASPKTAETSEPKPDVARSVALFLFGFIWGGFLVFLAMHYYTRRGNGSMSAARPAVEHKLEEKIKQAKNSKELLHVLMAVEAEDAALREIINQLEQAVYGGDSAFVADKKAILRAVEKANEPEIIW